LASGVWGYRAYPTPSVALGRLTGGSRGKPCKYWLNPQGNSSAITIRWSGRSQDRYRPGARLRGVRLHHGVTGVIADDPLALLEVGGFRRPVALSRSTRVLFSIENHTFGLQGPTGALSLRQPASRSSSTGIRPSSTSVITPVKPPSLLCLTVASWWRMVRFGSRVPASVVGFWSWAHPAKTSTSTRSVNALPAAPARDWAWVGPW